MRGIVRKISIPRRFIMDLMHASMRVPLVSFSRSIDIRSLIEARAALARPPGWAAIFVKAFALVAKDEPILRTLYIKWPWPHFFELPRSVCMVAIARVENGEDCILPEKVPSPEERPLTEIDAQIHYARDARLEDVPAFRKIMEATRLPLPLRRFGWWLARSVGRMYANNFGNFGVTSVAAYGPGELRSISPGPFLVSYGRVKPDHHIDVVLCWDHRITDGAFITKVMTRLEQVLNTEISAELHDLGPQSEPKPARAAGA